MLSVATLFAKPDKSDKTLKKMKIESNDMDSPKFTPLIPDSLDTTTMKILLHPERRKNFQRDNGVVTIPYPRSIEPNPGGIQEADPTVDLGIIYPLETWKPEGSRLVWWDAYNDIKHTRYK